MSITAIYRRDALRIAVAIQKYFNLIKRDSIKDDIEISLMDAYKIISKEGIIEIDSRWHDYRLEKFLNYLYKEKLISLLIPQCVYKIRINDEEQIVLSDVKFVSVPESLKRLEEMKDKIIITELDENLKNKILNYLNTLPDNNEKYNSEKKDYSRYGDSWTRNEEILLLESVAQTQDALVLSKLFGRKPSAIRIRLGRFKINIDFE